jgi:cytochrome c551/c552
MDPMSEQTEFSRGPRRGSKPVALLLIGASAFAVTWVGGGRLAAAGDPELGRVLFTDKACVGCHRPRGSPASGPALEELRRPQGEMELAGRIWNHVPEMFAVLAAERSQWPQITKAEMANLMAYLQADATRDQSPDLRRGQLILFRKGCLKCHSLAREGGRIEPDLSEPRADYESAAAWAAAMWTHTPAMAAMASRQGMTYPRFSDDEMGHLVGFLKQSAAGAARRGSRAGPSQ